MSSSKNSCNKTQDVVLDIEASSTEDELDEADEVEDVEGLIVTTQDEL